MNIFGSSSKLNIILVRAGATELDVQGRITGSLDIPVSEQGVAETAAVAAELDMLKIDMVYSADCLAAQYTAKAISRGGEIRVRVEESWENLNHGLWHGKSLDELKETQPKLYRQWKENPSAVCPPGGETVEEVRQRVAASLKKIRKKFRDGTVVIVAPQPLYQIIRCQLVESASEPPVVFQSETKRWESLEFSTGAMV